MKRDTKAKRDRSKPEGPRRTTMLHRLDIRLMAGVLAVAVPMMAGIAILLVSQSSTSLTGAARDKAASLSRSVALRLEDWISERHGELSVIAGRSISNEVGSSTQGLLGHDGSEPSVTLDQRHELADSRHEQDRGDHPH